MTAEGEGVSERESRRDSGIGDLAWLLQHNRPLPCRNSSHPRLDQASFTSSVVSRLPRHGWLRGMKLNKKEIPRHSTQSAVFGGRGLHVLGLRETRAS